jgi:hypothetical protein
MLVYSGAAVSDLAAQHHRARYGELTEVAARPPDLPGRRRSRFQESGFPGAGHCLAS